MCSHIQSLLDQVKATYDHMVNANLRSVKAGEQFNVFNVLGLWSEEVRLHSAMIAELLNPAGSHGCSDSFLKLFIDNVLKLPVSEYTTLAKAIVDTEYHIGQINSNGQEGGRIDVRVDLRVYQIPSLIIENKIYASDQENQLLRYYNYCKKEYASKGFRFQIVYLTLDGNCPSEFSTGRNSDISPLCISYYRDIIPWLKQCAQIAFDKPKIREILIQYIDLLNQITAYKMDEKNDVVKTVISTYENLISGLRICAQQTDLLEEAILGHIKNELEKIVNLAQTLLPTLHVEFEPYDRFDYRGGKIDWGFSYIISSDHGQMVGLKYIFDNWNLKNLYYGIDQTQTTRDGIANVKVFDEVNDNWPWGWSYMEAGYRDWDCETVSSILEDIHKNGTESNFVRIIIDSINKAASLILEHQSIK